MALSANKVEFKFVGENIEQVQQTYDNLLQDTSYIYLKYQYHVTCIQDRYLAPGKKTQELNDYQYDEIKEQQQSLTTFKKKTVDFIDSTCLILHKEYPKQPRENLTNAKAIKKALEAEQVS